MRPGAVAEAGSGMLRGPTAPTVLREPRGPSAIDEPSFIVAELAEPYQEDEELRRRMQELEQEDEKLWRRNQELENVQNRAVTATVIIAQAMMTKMQHPHHSVGKKEDVLRLPYFYLLESFLE